MLLILAIMQMSLAAPPITGTVTGLEVRFWQGFETRTRVVVATVVIPQAAFTCSQPKSWYQALPLATDAPTIAYVTGTTQCEAAMPATVPPGGEVDARFTSDAGPGAWGRAMPVRPLVTP